MSASFLTGNRTMQVIRARVAFHSRQHGFDTRMQQLVSSDEAITPTMLAELYAFWGDPLSAADEQFLRSCVAEAGNADGPVLLCGSSLLTLVLGAICARTEDKAHQVWCLEHDSHWASLIRSWLTEYRIGAAHVIQSPARFFDEYVWYAVDTSHLARSYRLIICDGTRATPEGIMGTLMRLQTRLDERFTVLARHVKDPAVLKYLRDWARHHDAKLALIDKHQGFLKLARQPVMQEEPVAAAASAPTRTVAAGAPARPAGA
jgi:hypothetical protein